MVYKENLQNYFTICKVKSTISFAFLWKNRVSRAQRNYGTMPINYARLYQLTCSAILQKCQFFMTIQGWVGTRFTMTTISGNKDLFTTSKSKYPHMGKMRNFQLRTRDIWLIILIISSSHIKSQKIPNKFIMARKYIQGVQYIHLFLYYLCMSEDFVSSIHLLNFTLERRNSLYLFFMIKQSFISSFCK